MWSGAGTPSSSRKTSRHHPVVVLAGVDDRVAALRVAAPRSAAITGAVLTKFGRVPTT